LPHPGGRTDHSLLDLDATVLHLAAVTLEADGAGFRHLELGFQDFAVAGAMGQSRLDHDLDVVSVLRLVFL
jgi:hypothetical protein